MNAPEIYVLLLLIAILAIALLVSHRVRKPVLRRVTPLGGLAFGLFLAGLFLGHEPPLVYGLIGAGVLLSLIDILRRSRGTPV